MFAIKLYQPEIVEILLRCPRVDLSAINLEEVNAEMKEVLWTCPALQQRMILRDSLLTRQDGSVPSLQSLSRDAVLQILSTNNTEERLVKSLVDRLGLNITRQTREMLLTSYSGSKIIVQVLRSSLSVFQV